DPTGTGAPPDQLRNRGAMVCSVSRDQGETWSDYQAVNPDWSAFLPWVDWDGDNEAWLAAIDSENVLVSHSEDGLDWDDPVVVGNYTNPPPNGAFGWPALNGSVFRSFALPSLAVDRTDGPHGGNIYVVWMDHSGDDADILFTRSTDQGETWSEPVVIHDDPAEELIDQFMPAINVGPDGTLDIVWLDRRDDPEHHLFDAYYTYSVDGGETFAPNLRVSEVSSDEQYSHHQNGMVFLGDYIDIDSTPGQAHMVWVDTRHEQADAFIAHVARPGANAS
ncbi:MAG: sialidase family protein, partial [Candidatus Thermoplasmatota archaeon]|nr:sialidase family protein [Candidatus Thermoplasmatota archaeon]